MNQQQITNVLENVNLIKKVYDVSGERAFVMYKDMVKANYDDYLGLKEKSTYVKVGEDDIGRPIVEELHEGESVLTENVIKEYSKTVDKLNESIDSLRKEVGDAIYEINGIKLKKNINSKGETVRISIDIDNKKANGSELAKNIVNAIRQRGGKI